jgi:MFS transporter, MHS family, proline/betaine transporter
MSMSTPRDFGMADALSPEPREARDAHMRRRVIWSSTVGNALEWFDFMIFGLFAETIGKLFFPKTDETASLLAAYGLLAVAYLARPIGGVFFGALADRVGRKRALVSIVLLMAFSTTVIAILPTFAQIGVAAPMLLLLARLIQGFSAGGEFGTSTAMLIEFSPPERRGVYASFQLVAQAIALAGGAAFATILHRALTPEDFESWGWRLPFLAGIIIGPVGFYLRSAVDETPEFKAFLAKLAGIPNTPLREVLMKHPRALIALMLIIAGMTANTYIGAIFLPNFAHKDLKLDLADAQFGLFLVNVASIAALPIAGWLSDRFGRWQVMVPAIILFLAVALSLAKALLDHPSTEALWALQAAGIVSVFASGPACALILEVFPVNVRSSGASIAYNFAVAIFGGLSPLITRWMVDQTHDNFAPFYYLFGCFVLTLIGLALVPWKARSTATP